MANRTEPYTYDDVIRILEIAITMLGQMRDDEAFGPVPEHPAMPLTDEPAGVRPFCVVDDCNNEARVFAAEDKRWRCYEHEAARQEKRLNAKKWANGICSVAGCPRPATTVGVNERACDRHKHLLGLSLDQAQRRAEADGSGS